MKEEKPRKKIRRRVFTETKQTLLVVEPETDLHCSFCGFGESPGMASPLQAARLFNVSTREIYRLIETGDLHSIEFEDRRIFVCLKSPDRNSAAFFLKKAVKAG